MPIRSSGAGYVTAPSGTLPTSADNWSWCGWYERAVDQNAESVIVNFAGNAGTIGQLRVNSNGDSIVIGNQTALSGTLHTLANNEPVFLAMSCSAGTITAYARRITDGSFTTLTLARSSYAPIDSTIGGMTWGWQVNGRFANQKWFSRAVTAAEWGNQWRKDYVIADLAGVCLSSVQMEGADLTAALAASVGSNYTSSGTLTVEAFATTGRITRDAVSDITLGPVTLATTGTIEIKGTSTVALGSITLAATGKLGIKGTSTITLSPITLATTGKLDIAGTSTVALDSITLAADGVLTDGLTGAASITLDPIGLQSSGELTGGPTGAASITLDPIGLQSSGELTGGAPPPPAPAPVVLGGGGGGRTAVSIDGTTYIGDYASIAQIVEAQAQREARPTLNRRDAKRAARQATRDMSQRLMIAEPLVLDFASSDVVSDTMFKDLRNLYVSAYVEHAMGVARLMIQEQNKMAMKIAEEMLL